MSDAIICPPCICCGATFENIDREANQPNDGLEFTAYGHYGTGVFDPMDGSHLVINVCDPCLVKAGGLGRVLYAETSFDSRKRAPMRPWKAD